MNPRAQQNSAHAQRFPRKPLPSSGAQHPSFPGSRPRVCGNWAVFCRLHGPRGRGAAGQGSQPLLQALVFATRPPPPQSPVALRDPCPRGRQGAMRPVTSPCSSLCLRVGEPRPAEAMGFVLDQPSTRDCFWPRATDIGGSTGSGRLLGTEHAPRAASLWGCRGWSGQSLGLGSSGSLLPVSTNPQAPRSPPPCLPHALILQPLLLQKTRWLGSPLGGSLSCDGER